MTRSRWLPRGAWGLVVVFALSSLVFLGSPGCGCGDDDLVPRRGGTPRCCCTYEWLAPRDVDDTTAVVSLEGADASLAAQATPSVLTGVVPFGVETFQVCVNADHTLSDRVTLVIRGQTSGTEYGRVDLVYGRRCGPVFDNFADGFELTSPDCGGDTLICCCIFEWLPGPNTPSVVNLVAQNADASLDVSIAPTQLTGVEPGVLQTFEVCVDAGHVLLDGFDLVIVPVPVLEGPPTASIVAEVGRARVVYRTRCTPDIGDVPGTPTLELTSTECGGAPLGCCCNFTWQPPADVFGDVTLTAEKVSPGLGPVTITPNFLISVDALDPTFEICVNGAHGMDDGFVLVARTSPGGQEIGRMQFAYKDPCIPAVFDIPDFDALNISSEDCGIDPYQCCCDIRFTADPEFGTHDVTITLENVEGSLQPASVAPSSISGLTQNQVVIFQVCVDPRHNTLAGLDLVIRNASTGLEYGRLPLEFEECVPVPGDPSGGAGNYEVLCGPLVD